MTFGLESDGVACNANQIEVGLLYSLISAVDSDLAEIDHSLCWAVIQFALQEKSFVQSCDYFDVKTRQEVRFIIGI